VIKYYVPIVCVIIVQKILAL